MPGTEAYRFGKVDMSTNVNEQLSCNEVTYRLNNQTCECVHHYAEYYSLLSTLQAQKSL